MGKRGILCLFMIFAIAMSAFAEITITGKAPTTGNGTVDAELATAFNELKNNLNDELKGMNIDGPENFIRAWGNAGVFASHGATPRAYGGYDVFSASIGVMIGVQLPMGLGKLLTGSSDAFGDLEDDIDVPLGLNPQMFNAQFSMRPAKVLSVFPEKLYLGVRFGVFNLKEMELGEDVALGFKNGSFGITANYQLIDKKSLAKVIEWRGITLGSGFIYQHTNLNLSMPLDTIEADNGKLKIDPKMFVDFNINTVTIPLEAMTSLKLLFLNIPFGVGADIAFGASKFEVGMNADIVADSYTIISPGNIKVAITDKYSPTFFNLKIMTGVGFKFGPVFLDIPVTFYPAYKNKGKGYNVGLTLGAVL